MNTPEERSEAKIRDHYKYFISRPTRWDDNDHYGHLNNAVYYAYFDCTVGDFLREVCKLDVQEDRVVAYVVHSQCNYIKSLAYPDDIEIGLRINRMGRSSLEYGVAMFKQGETEAAATATFTYVYVDRETNTSAPVPDSVRSSLSPYVK